MCLFRSFPFFERFLAEEDFSVVVLGELRPSDEWARQIEMTESAAAAAVASATSVGLH